MGTITTTDLPPSGRKPRAGRPGAGRHGLWRLTLAALGAGTLAGCGTAAQPSGSPRALRDELAGRPSATAVLQSHCDRLTGGGVPVRAYLQPASNAPRPADLQTVLAIPPFRRDAIGIRHVSLRCGTVALSDAWNWYVPGRLTPAMNGALDSSDAPFGRVVADLHFRRQTLGSAWEGLPAGTVLRNRAVLRRQGDDAPIAYVEENYLADALR